MMRISIQPGSGIPGSVQLFNLLCFAIACGQFPPGCRLPSTRQLAMQTACTAIPSTRFTTNSRLWAWWKPALDLAFT
jgi:DNA-binding transcriptional regulator YhcF (GntR family)